MNAGLRLLNAEPRFIACGRHRRDRTQRCDRLANFFSADPVHYEPGLPATIGDPQSEAGKGAIEIFHAPAHGWLQGVDGALGESDRGHGYLPLLHLGYHMGTRTARVWKESQVLSGANIFPN
jgi:hypothetical protein